MSTVTNLNKFRKRRARAEKQRQAQENRVRFGRTKDEKKLAAIEKDKAAGQLDNHRLSENE